MRAIYLEDIPNEYFLLENEKAHHLLHVVRIKESDKILILNGKGQSQIFEAKKIKKRSIEFHVDAELVNHSPQHQLDLLVCIVKKEAMDLSLKQSCELGISNIYLASSAFSQKYKMNFERLKKHLVSGVEQANNPYLPTLSQVSLMDFDYASYDKIMYFSSIEGRQSFDVLSSSEKILLIIGPEGGLASDEEEFITSKNNSFCIKFNTPIQRMC